MAERVNVGNLRQISSFYLLFTSKKAVLTPTQFNNNIF